MSELFYQGIKTLLDVRSGQEASVNVFWLAERLCDNMHFRARILPHLTCPLCLGTRTDSIRGPQTLMLGGPVSCWLYSEQGLSSASPAAGHTVPSSCRKGGASVQLWKVCSSPW